MAANQFQARPKTSHNVEPIVDNWRRESVLGSGAFGIISLWRNVTTNERLALKQCRITGSNEGEFGNMVIINFYRELRLINS